MPDNKGVGWRKKIHGSKPKDIPGDDIAAADDPGDRRRHTGWRKTLRGSRPETPVSRVRYTSLFSSFKEPSKPEFSEPWSDSPPFQPYIDPLNALQSIRSHMITCSSKPIPLEHNNGLFRIFEDYRKVRGEKEHLETLLRDTFRDWKIDEEQWSEAEGRYEAEIRRLDILIARGTSGLTGLIEARQGSIVVRKPRHRKTISNNKLPPMYEFLSPQQLDNEIKLKSQRVLLHRPTSPSGKMVALSKQFANMTVDLPVGNPPDEEEQITLSRKVQSELNLCTAGRIDFSQSITHSVNSGFSGSIGDPLPDELIASTPAALESGVDCDAFVALRELGALVAKRRGLKVDSFVENLLALLSDASDEDHGAMHTQEGDLQPASLGTHLLSSNQRRRRYFSFEPGDDQFQELEEVVKLHEAQYGDSDSSDADSQLSEVHLANSNPPAKTLFADFQKPSKIPSPVQSLGRVRRENSNSSVQSGGLKDDRRSSHSSILTALRDKSSGSLRLDSKSRSSSIHNLHATESSLSPRDLQGSLRFYNSAVASAAARAADKTPVSMGDS